MAGNITIIVPSDNFVKVPLGIVFHPEVDALALGIFVKVLCLGREFSLTVQDLAARLSVSLAKVQKAFAVLEDAGYLRRNRVKDATGRFVGWDYEISSEPLTDTPENRRSEKPTIGKTDCRKIGSSVPYNNINNNISNTRDNINTVSSNNTGINSKSFKKEKKDTVERKEKKPTAFRKPSVEEVAEYCRERQNGIDAAEFVAFYESKGWLVGKSPMKDWRQAVITWEIRSKHSGRKDTSKPVPLGDYITNLIQDMKDYYGTDTPDEQ